LIEKLNQNLQYTQIESFINEH